MAESVLFDLASNVIGALSPPFLQEISRLWGIGDELEKLRGTVSTIQAVLLDAEKKSCEDHQVKNWLHRLKDALYEAEDFIDGISVQSRLRDLRSQNKIMKEVRTFFSSSNQLIFRLTMANKLKEVKAKIDAIKADRGFFLEECRSEKGLEIRRGRREQTHSFIRSEEIIGRDNAKREIIRQLMEFNLQENVSVVSIVGIGGLGKTKLAQYVYNNKAVQKHFELTMWVCVSEVFDIKIIVGNIIESAKKEKVEHLQMEQMQSALRKEIDGRRYLLVLDDLWNDNRNQWLGLKSLLDGGARGSKILVTTRAEIVAKAAGTISPYFLEGLSSDESLKLFMQVASEETQEISETEKMSIGKETVKKCSGSPLAIRVIGGLFYFQRTTSEWLYFKEKHLQKFMQEDNDIIAILKLSYDYLPSHLKQCFAFCSLFPKDYFIPKSTLIRSWISQGFIQPSSNGDLDVEDTAHECFTYLLWRNFFQDARKDGEGNVEECKMHDLMHDLACQMAGRESCNINEFKRGARHVSYWSNRDLSSALPQLEDRNTKVRTLLSLEELAYTSSKKKSGDELSESICVKIMSNFRCLHFLTLHDTNMKVVPSTLSKLKHLCFLDLSHNKKMERLPRSIKGLQNLVTLKLNNCESLKELSNDIGSLGSLKHLHLDRFCKMKYMPRSLRQLTSLRTLTYFIAGDYKSSPKNCARLSDLSGLNNLQGRLWISIGGHIKNAIEESRKADIRAKHSLEELTIEWRDIEYKEAELIENQEILLEELQPHINLRKLDIVGYKGARFPRWMVDDITQSLPNLVEFRLWGCDRCRHLPPFGLLPRLKFLWLKGLNAVESIDDYNYGHSSSNLATGQRLFPGLSWLWIEECPNLKSMPLLQDLLFLKFINVSEELLKQSFQLQKLKWLWIERIAYLQTLPTPWIENLSSLMALRISGCPNMTSLPLGIQQLSSLVSLAIINCELLDLSVDENHNEMQELQGLRSLENILILKLPKLTSLPHWLLVTSLKWLRLSGCSNLVSISNHLGDLTSLHRIEIVKCPNLTSLPESMSRLKSLKYLRIAGCPELEDKCKIDGGVEWDKTAHVLKVSHQLFYWEEEEWELELLPYLKDYEEAVRRNRWVSSLSNGALGFKISMPD